MNLDMFKFVCSFNESWMIFVQFRVSGYVAGRKFFGTETILIVY